MAAPFAHDDLEKLKKFIDFVSSNPPILNMPQLEFVKKFIEKFGGTVPAGEFEMPAGGGKCPFGGDAQPESKPAPTPAPEQDEGPEQMDEDDEDSEESELELDEEEIDVPLFKPNVIYLDEKPPKIVKDNDRVSKKRRKKKMKTKRGANKIKVKKEPAAKKCKKPKQLFPLSMAAAALNVKKEVEQQDQQQQREDNGEISGDDPLFTPEIEIKMEIETEGLAAADLDKKPVVNYYTNNEDFNSDEMCGSATSDDVDDDDDDEEEEDFESKLQRDMLDESSDENDEMELEDEPLIMLSRRRGRPRLHPEKESSKIKAPSMDVCREICKHHCTKKFTEEQRQSACDQFWAQTHADRVDFLRKHIRARRYRVIQRNKPSLRDNNYVYYLDNHDGSSVMIRVCRKYFEATLSVTNHIVKKAIDGYQLEPEQEMIPLWQQVQEERKHTDQNKANEIQQVLDPETGDLVTIDPKARKEKKIGTHAKKKRIRRKPGDPNPEHFPKPIKCEIRCIFKCHTLFSEQERKQICDSFWALDYKRRKDFILARIESKDVSAQLTPEFRRSNRPPRGYHSKCYLRAGVNGENKRVCKHFLLATLCISRHFIENALEFADKATGCYTGSDRRGHNTAPNRMKPECKQAILDHIKSYPCWMPNKKSKTRYLHHKLTIKKMYNDFKEMCLEQQRKSVSCQGYYKAFHDDFRLAFLCNREPKRGGGFLKLNPNISHYTGEEPGGFWMQPNGEKLDVTNSNIDLTKNWMRYPRRGVSLNIEHKSSYNTLGIAENMPEANYSLCTTAPTTTAITNSSNSAVILTGSSVSAPPPTSAPVPAPAFSLNQPLNYAHFMDPSALAVLNAGGGLCPPQSSGIARHDFNTNLYDNSLVQAHSSSTTTTTHSSVLRRL